MTPEQAVTRSRIFVQLQTPFHCTLAMFLSNHDSMYFLVKRLPVCCSWRHLPALLLHSEYYPKPTDESTSHLDVSDLDSQASPLIQPWWLPACSAHAQQVHFPFFIHICGRLAILAGGISCGFRCTINCAAVSPWSCRHQRHALSTRRCKAPGDGRL